MYVGIQSLRLDTMHTLGGILTSQVANHSYFKANIIGNNSNKDQFSLHFERSLNQISGVHYTLVKTEQASIFLHNWIMTVHAY